MTRRGVLHGGTERGPRRRAAEGLRTAGALGALLLVAAGCHRLPPLAPLPAGDRAALEARCSALFPKGRWEATHGVDASLPLGQETSLLGVVSARKNGRGFRSVLMSQEGLVLLDASYDAGRVVTHRAVPPLDREGFDAGMASDIRLVLFPPEGPLVSAGHDADGVPTCRWQEDGGVIQAGLTGARRAWIERRDRRHRVVRTARLEGIDGCGFARETVLESRGLAGYRLRLTLVEHSATGCEEVSAAPR